MCLVKSFLLLFLIGLAGCAGGPGQPEEREEGYRRIISLGPTITQNIYLLGREDLIVGVSSYCRGLPGAGEKEIAGDLINVNVEQVLKLSPDIVMTTDLVRPDMLDKLRSFGIKVMVFPEPESFEDTCSHFLELGRALGEYEKAEDIIMEIRNKTAVLKKEVEGLPRRKVLVQIGSNPLWVSPKNSFINDIIEFAGGINIGPARGGMVSVEEVLKQNPDVIMIVDMGIGEEQRKMWENYPVMNAVKNQRIYLVDSYTFCSPTPAVFLKALEETAEILNG